MAETETKPRIWEIDALRGVLILCVIVAHALYCGEYMLGLYRLPGWLNTVLFQHAGSLFVVLSGLSATLGRHSLRRGLLVFGGGMVLTLGSAVGVLLHLIGPGYIIWFGVLHLIGLCMLLYPLLKRLSDPALLVFGAAVIGLGLWFASFYVKNDVFFALGLHTREFSSGDYFPVFPQLGWFCLGIVLGRRLYPEKTTVLPQIDSTRQPWRTLCFLGRHTLPVFVCHLPVVGAIMFFIAAVLRK